MVQSIKPYDYNNPQAKAYGTDFNKKIGGDQAYKDDPADIEANDDPEAPLFEEPNYTEDADESFDTSETTESYEKTINEIEGYDDTSNSDSFADDELGLSSLESLESGDTGSQIVLDKKYLLQKIRELQKALIKETKKLPNILIKEYKNKLRELQKELSHGKAEKDATELENIFTQLEDIETAIVASATSNLKKQFDEAQNLLDKLSSLVGNPNLSEDQRAKFQQQLDTLTQTLTQDPWSAEGILNASMNLQGEVEKEAQFSTLEEKLAYQFNQEPASIQKILQKYHVDSNSINEITPALMNALKELNPEIKNLEQAVITAQQNRIAKEKGEQQAAQNIANSNGGSESDYDNLDPTHFVYLAKAQSNHRDTDEALAVKEARRKLRDKIIETLSFMTDGAVTTDGVEYDTIDRIAFNGKTYYLTDANGNLNPSTETHPDSVIELVTWKYDWEGTGDLEDRGGKPGWISEYNYPANCYDDYHGDWND
ncbi:MAG: hypothetical protein HYU97_03510 [Deltaproteobacteria bacterium]|nr:hypothetical protein [Deltaproteobacteria bacterium]